MPKKYLYLFALLPFLGVFAGCATVQVSEKFNGQSIVIEEGHSKIAHITVTNTGIYMLNTVPVFSGDSKEPGNTALLEDHVNLADMFDILTAKASELGALKVVDVRSRYKSSWIPFSVFLWHNEIELSGNAVK